jgi:hypothetical protein
MHSDDKKYSRSDYLLGNVDPYDMEVPYATSSTFEELFKTKPKEKVVKQPIRRGNANKLLRPTPPAPVSGSPAVPRTTMVKGKPGEFNMAEPGRKLLQLKDSIRNQSTKPTIAQKELYFELSEEIERRGESYFQKLEELYNPGDNNGKIKTKIKPPKT